MTAKAAEALLWALAALNLVGAAAFAPLLAGRDAALWAGWAGVLSGAVFLGRAGGSAPQFWDRLRCSLAGMACALWGLYLLFFAAGFAYWTLDLLFAVIGLLLWLRRDKAMFLIPAAGIFAVIGVRHIGQDLVISALNLLLTGFVLWRGGRLTEEFLARRAAPPRRTSPLRAGLALLALALLGWFIARPLYLMVNPASRHRMLEAAQPAFPIQPPGTLSPQAGRLRGHVLMLAETIGERSAFQPDEQDRARDYVAAQLRAMGYEVELQEYAPLRRSASGRVRPYYNIEARLPGRGSPGEADWILGAHYDTAPGTPGAEDNASAVAVLLEAARELKKAPGGRGVRFVSWSTEEPPAFTTRDMGSYRYLRLLRERGVKIHGLLNMDMVGYFNPKAGSQLFPPLLSALHPDTGDFVSLAGNLSSLGLLRSVEASWKKASALPVEPVFLPSVASALFLGDHLNFWFAGERAVFITDTAYFRFPYYHRYEDTPEKLDYEKMAELTRAVTAVLAGG